MQNLLPVFQSSIDAVCIDWNQSQSKQWGFTVTVSGKSIQKAHLFVVDLIKDNPALPPNPGPFKIAASFLVSCMHFLEFSFLPVQDAEILSESEKKLWKSRFLFKAISVFLLQLELSSTGKKLQKIWDVPSVHYRLDLLNFIRWCEFPIDGPSDPPPPSKPTVDMVRVNRLIMAMTLIIEACYYISENTVVCDVKDNVHIKTDEIEASILPDLFFDCKT